MLKLKILYHPEKIAFVDPEKVEAIIYMSSEGKAHSQLLMSSGAVLNIDMPTEELNAKVSALKRKA